MSKEVIIRCDLCQDIVFHSRFTDFKDCPVNFKNDLLCEKCLMKSFQEEDQETKKDRSNWVFMGHPAHFIGAKDCKFFIATNVGDYIVSTIGEWFPDREIRRSDLQWIMKTGSQQEIKLAKRIYDLQGIDFDNEYYDAYGLREIGHNRTYETLVFESMPAYNCCPYVPKTFEEKDFIGSNSAKEATKNHYYLCNRYSN